VITGNGTPRVFRGAALGRHFQELPLLTRMTVEVMSLITIRIRPAPNLWHAAAFAMEGR
jgi:hypothetical protein